MHVVYLAERMIKYGIMTSSTLIIAGQGLQSNLGRFSKSSAMPHVSTDFRLRHMIGPPSLGVKGNEDCVPEDAESEL